MKVVQVGVGGMGNTWLGAVNESSDVEYAGWVEINNDIAAAQAEQYGFDPSLIFKSLEEAIEVIMPDGVIDVTPPQFHKQVSTTALRAGIPVLSEKPLANTMKDAKEIVRVAEETGVLHMVAQNYRYRPPVQTLRRLVQSGDLGVLGSVQMEFYKGIHFGGFREDMDYPLIIDMSIHHFDMLRFVLDSSPVSIYGRSWSPVWNWFKGDASATVSMQFENGVVVSYDGSWCSSGMETSWNADWTLRFEKGVVRMVQDEISVQRWEGVEDRTNIYAKLELIEQNSMEREAQAYLLHEFYEAVMQGKPVATTCQDNIHSLQMVFNCVASFESGHVMRVG